ncbi:MAG: hypothetical protein DCC50_03905 [Acidobacteria bacterium]|nr:MAG: hypothetical protein DCC50_03905 [Acidobacteriota bacterium]
MTDQPHQPGTAPEPRPSSPSGVGGFFKALFDLDFDTFVTPVIVKIVYLVGMVLIGLVSLFLFLTSFRHFGGGLFANPLLGIVQLVGAPLLGIFYLAFFRMSLELYYAVIRLSEDVHHGRGRL